ncbi:MAG: MotA/TolQ/ExbB proton channel family protein [Pedosphaera sp.]|nr:MotA/TolQ/ExbB proton channel family protein [Pedosphaera sp.]
MILLVLTSIVSVAFIIERGLALRWSKVIPAKVEFAVENCRSGDDLPRLCELCQEQPSAFSRVVMVAQDHLNCPREENADAIQTRARHEVLQLERGLVILEVVVGISPLLGLVGTIHGLITLFHDLGGIGLADNTVIARGIGITLNTTLMGLLIAIPSLVCWSYYTKKVETLAIEMETLCDEFLRRQYRSNSRN